MISKNLHRRHLNESKRVMVGDLLLNCCAKVVDMAEDVREIRTTQAAMLQLLASHDNHMLRMEDRLGRMGSG